MSCFTLLKDPSFEVRYETIRSLGRLPKTEKNIRKLKSCLKYEDDIEIQIAAISALGQLKVKEAAQLLYPFLENRFSILRMRAARALGAIGDAEAGPLLMHMVESDEEEEVSFSAALALGRIHHGEALPGLLSLYNRLNVESKRHEHKQKAILMAMAQILDVENEFSKIWRLENRQPGIALPEYFRSMVKSLRRFALSQAKLGELSVKATAALADGKITPAADALLGLAPLLQKIKGFKSDSTVSLLSLLRDKPVHPALIVLACAAVKTIVPSM